MLTWQIPPFFVFSYFITFTPVLPAEKIFVKVEKYLKKTAASAMLSQKAPINYIFFVL